MHRVLTIAIALCWPVYGLLAMMLFQRIAGRQPSPWFMMSVAASWLVVGFVWGKWVNRNKCPQCGKPHSVVIASGPVAFVVRTAASLKLSDYSVKRTAANRRGVD